MMVCRKFSDDDIEDEYDSLTEGETEDESEVLDGHMIIVDMKTASIFQMSLEEALEKRLMNMVQKTDDELKGASYKYTIQESCTLQTEREEIKNKLKKHPTLGVATRLVIRKSTIIEEEYTDLREKEAVTALWGISLKSTNKKKKKNEELFFFDPYTEAAGELDREKAIKMGCITETRNQFDKLVLAEAIDKDAQWESLRERIRTIMDIQMEEDAETRIPPSSRYSTDQALVLSC
jgi:hypothetical protein